MFFPWENLEIFTTSLANLPFLLRYYVLLLWLLYCHVALRQVPPMYLLLVLPAPT